jgi:hypothetical protein
MTAGETRDNAKHLRTSDLHFGGSSRETDPSARIEAEVVDLIERVRARSYAANARGIRRRRTTRHGWHTSGD